MKISEALRLLNDAMTCDYCRGPGFVTQEREIEAAIRADERESRTAALAMRTAMMGIAFTG